MYIIGKYTLQQSIKLREQVLKIIDVKGHFTDVWGEAVISKNSEKIIDPALPKRSNGVLLLGSRKPQTTVGPHYVFFRGVWRNGWLEENRLPEGWHLKRPVVFRDLFCRMYGFIWEKFKPVPTKEEEKISPSITEVSKTGFNLVAFLEASKGVVPDNTKWKQLCAYFASQGLDPAQTCDICNPAWGYNDRETQNMMQLAIDNNKFDVKKNSFWYVKKIIATCQQVVPRI